MSHTNYFLERDFMESMPLLSDRLYEDIMNIKGILPPEVAICDLNSFGNVDILLMGFEKYYYRNNSAASVTVQVVNYDGKQKATVCATGGGGGILNLSWGANTNFAQSVVDVLINLGFEVTASDNMSLS